MGNTELVQVFNSQTQAYHDAFQIFLDHTDQKVTARAWLERCIQALPARRVFVDAGAGEGQVTAWIAPAFDTTLAIEPNPHLREEFRKACPRVPLSPRTILENTYAETADLVLCSHVFYYIAPAEWMQNLEKLVSWLAPEGVLLVILQNHQTDCMRMLDHFLGQHFDLSALGERFERDHGETYTVSVETVPAYITTADFQSAYVVAEFMLNLLPLPNPPYRKALEEYVHNHFRNPTGGFHFSCHQDVLQIRTKM